MVVFFLSKKMMLKSKEHDCIFGIVRNVDSSVIFWDKKVTYNEVVGSLKTSIISHVIGMLVLYHI